MGLFGGACHLLLALLASLAVSFLKQELMSNDSPAPAKSQRLLYLDAFRGMTIIGMVLVNDPGSWGAGDRYALLNHAPWHGWTPTDWIFPPIPLHYGDVARLLDEKVS